MKKHDFVKVIDKRLRFLFVISGIFLIFALIEVIVGTTQLGTLNVFRYFTMQAVILAAFFLALLVFIIIRRKNRKPWDYICLGIIIAVLLFTFFYLLPYSHSQAMPHRYVRLTEITGLWYEVSYYEGLPEPGAVIELTGTKKVVDLNFIVSLIMFTSCTVANILILRRKNESTI